MDKGDNRFLVLGGLAEEVYSATGKHPDVIDISQLLPGPFRDEVLREAVALWAGRKSTLLQRSISKGIELVGETAWQLDKLGVDLDPDIPLRDIAGMRHILVHHYDGVDWNLVEDVAFNDIPALQIALERVLEEPGVVIRAGSWTHAMFPILEQRGNRSWTS